MNKLDYCVVCGNAKSGVSNLQKHHLYPRRWFGQRGVRVFLCREHHQEIEQDICKLESRPDGTRHVLKRQVYLNLVFEMIRRYHAT